MQDFPLELQALIIKNLDPLDIYHLQQTCRHFGELINGNVEVWKNCLRLKTAREGLIWASFSTFSTASEFKDACTGPFRFKRLYCRDGLVRNDISHRGWRSEEGMRLPKDKNASRALPGDDESNPRDDDDEEDEEDEEESEFDDDWPIESIRNPRPGIDDLYLVPGGRFLITVQAECIILWNLPNFGSSDGPSLLLRHNLYGHGTVRISFADVLDDKTLRLYLDDVVHDAEGVIVATPSTEGAAAIILHILEVHIPLDGDDSGYLVREVASLPVAFPGDFAWSFSYDWPRQLWHCDDTILFHAGDEFSGCSMVWNYRNQEVRTWQVAGIKHINASFLHQDHVFYITPEGLYGIPLSQSSFRPVQNQVIMLLDSDTTATDGSYPPLSFPHSPYTFEYPHCVALVGTSNDDPEGPFTYELVDSKRPGSIHRYVLSFLPDSPTTSTIHLAQVIPTGEEYPPLYRFSIGDGSIAYIWEDGPDGRGVELIIHTPKDPTDSELNEGPSGDDSTFEYLDLSASLLIEPKPSDLLGKFSACPVSGRVAVIWDRKMEEDNFVEIFDFF